MKGFIFPFEKPEVWHLAVELADLVLSLLDGFPAQKHFRLIGQMEAAVASVEQNIAEGKGRQYRKEFIQHLYIALGSLFEVVTLAKIFKRKGILGETEATQIREKCETIDHKLHGLLNSLKNRT
jgi:four helix bundle protein